MGWLAKELEAVPTGRSQKLRQLLLGAVFVGALFYAGFLGLNIGTYAGGSDSSGYLNSARLLKFLQVDTPQRTLPGHLNDHAHPFLYVPLGFRPMSETRMAPSYPIGLPAMIAAASSFTSWRVAASWVIWLHAMAGLALIYGLARQAGLASGWALLAVVLMATSPLYLSFSLVLMSDMPATVWAMAAVLLAALSRERARWALAAGLAVGVAVLVRPSNALVFIPVVALLGWRPRQLLVFGLGGAPLAIAYVVYNHFVQGFALSGGYADLGGVFSSDAIVPTLWHYARWLPVLLTPLALLVFGLPWCRTPERRWKIALLAWMLAYAGFYVAYVFTRETWWFLRFLLPAFPACWIAALLVGRELTERWKFFEGPESISGRGGLIAVVGCVALLGWNVHWNRDLETSGMGRLDEFYRDGPEWLKSTVPPDSIIVSAQTSGALFYYTSFVILRWDSIQESSFPAIAATAARAGRPIFALLSSEEERPFTTGKHVRGRWQRVADFQRLRLWRYDGGADVPAVFTETR